MPYRPTKPCELQDYQLLPHVRSISHAHYPSDHSDLSRTPRSNQRPHYLAVTARRKNIAVELPNPGLVIGTELLADCSSHCMEELAPAVLPSDRLPRLRVVRYAGVMREHGGDIGDGSIDREIDRIDRDLFGENARVLQEFCESF
jgi:hypothetical protein